MPRLPVCLVSPLLLVAISCSSARQITTPPPVSGIPQDTMQTARAESRLTVVLEVGRTPLPDEIQSVRFQIGAASLKRSGSPWISVPVDPAPLTLPQGANARPSILSTFIAPGTYDSLALAFQDVFVLFNENSGAPLGTMKEKPLVLPLTFTAHAAGSDTLTLTLEPGPSLLHTRDCRWFFVPFIVLVPQTTPVGPDAEKPGTP